jgi:hypothetical protein
MLREEDSDNVKVLSRLFKEIRNAPMARASDGKDAMDRMITEIRM